MHFKSKPLWEFVHASFHVLIRLPIRLYRFLNVFFCFQNEPIILANQYIPRAPQSRAVLTREAVESNTTYNPPIVCPRNIHAKKPQ